MREMNSGVAEDIVNGETAMVGTRPGDGDHWFPWRRDHGPAARRIGC